MIPKTDVSDTRSGVLPAILWGGLAVFVLDGIFAMVWSGLRGATPVRVWQGVAYGFFGRASFQGGLTTTAIGLLVHFTVAMTAAAVYVAASTRASVLLKYAIPSGLAYGVAVFLFMQYVVIPLSAIGPRPFSLNPFLIGMIGHMFVVGLPIALIARRYLAK